MLLSIVLLPLLIGTVLTALIGHRDTPRRRLATAWVAAAVTGAALALLISQAGPVFDGRTLLTSIAWLPELGLNLAFRLDGLALMFAILITAIGLLIILYAHYYLGKDDPAGKFFGLLMLFMAAMLGVVLSDNLLLLVVFWELTSVSSFLLVGYWKHRADARQGARMALAVTGGGGLAMLAGVLVLGQIAGTYEISGMLGRAAEIQAHAHFPIALVLILLGCFTKSAQFPFHFWLPEAMAAPTPVSAYLHSATMVKAGVFLLARMYPILGGESMLFEVIVTGAGLITLVFAAYVAVFKHDLKGLLAYSTISHLGLITFLIGLGSPLSAVAAVFHILNHATFKAALFMTAGIIDHETGTRDMRRLGGLWAFMPWTATLGMVAAASMAGVPMFNGFLSKEMMLTEAVNVTSGLWAFVVPAGVTFASICSVAYSVRFIHDVFFNGQPKDMPNPHPHEPPLFMKAPVGLLAVLCVLVGLLPALTYGPMVHVAATAVWGQELPDYYLSIWHGFNLPLLLSVVALVGGTLMYFALQHKFNLHLHAPRGWTGRLIFTRLVDGLFAGASRVTAWVENGSLQRYVAFMIGSVVVLGGYALLSGDGLSMGQRELLPANPLAFAVWVLLVVALGSLVMSLHDRFRAVVLVGVVGLVAAVTFVALSAPDLAMTQLSVELVATVLLLMALALMPQTTPHESSGGRKLRDAILALAGGAGVSTLAWTMMTRDHDSISWYFLENAVPLGGGTNAVNVILVDFRGYDTYGEIIVLGIAAVGVMALLDGMRVRRPTVDAQGEAWTFARAPLMLRTAARLVLPMALAVTLYIFFRGHNLPGGGFIAGLVTAVALTVQYLALGQAQAETLLRSRSGERYVSWIGWGLLIAGATGVGSFVVGHPFLTSAYAYADLGWLGKIPLSSALAFDLGVYATVVGAAMLLLSALASASKEPAPAGAQGAHA